ncbi:ribonuclease H-like domain-containing protein [Tanacetum coccineum]
MWTTDRVVTSTPGSAITIPETANEFSIKGNHLTLVKGNQFDGRTKTDPHKHIYEFLEICDMFKYRDTKNEAIRLMMFPLSLTGSSNSDTDKIMARMDAMTMKMDAQCKEFQSHYNKVMDPNSSLGKIFLGDNVIEISSDKVEGSRDWNSPEYQDTAGSKGKVMNALSFYKMETYEVSERYIAPCFVNGLEAYDGEINLAYDENLISNEFALYFVKFIINPEEDDVEPGVILGRSFMRIAKGIVDFGNGVITVYPEPDPFEDDSEKTEKCPDDWDQLLDFNFDDVPKFGEELPPLVCKMGKSSQNRKRVMDNLSLFYQDIGPSSSAGRHLTQEEAAKEALAIRIGQKFALLEEVSPVIETMAYHDKYKKILDEIWKDKVELDGKTMKEEEEAIKRIKGEELKEKDDPAFIFSIRLEGKVNVNAFIVTGSDINTMPYRIYETLGREEMKKVNRRITMINHTQVEAMGILTNVLCQVGVTTIIAELIILDIPIDCNAPIVVGRGFLYTMGSILNTSEKLFSTFDGVCHQTFRAARFDVLRTAESDSDDEEEYEIKRNKFGAPIYDSKPASYLNCTNPTDRSSAIQTIINPFWKISVWKKADSFLGSLPMPLKQVNWKPDYKGCYTKEEEATGQWRVEIRLTGPYGNIYLQGFTTKKTDRKDAKSRYNTRLANLLPRHIYSPCVVNWDVLNWMGCDGEIDDMLRIKLREAESGEEIFTSVA